MKIAITAKEESVEGKLDPRFGRCAYFMIYDTDNKNQEFFYNKGQEGAHGAGTSAAQWVVDQGVQKVISGEFGPKAQEILHKFSVETETVSDEPLIKELIASL